jgi:hypothetical protein
MSEKHGIKETKEVVVAVLGHVAPLLIKRFKDGVGFDDVSAIMAKWNSDEEFKAALQEAFDDVKKIPDEVSDLDLSEGLDLGMAAVMQVPKIVEAFK